MIAILHFAFDLPLIRKTFREKIARGLVKGPGAGCWARKWAEVDPEGPLPCALTVGNMGHWKVLDDGQALREKMPMSFKKPPYAIPTMAEICTMEPNGYTLVSLFSGCGGSCLGFRMEGFKVLWANEFIPAAQEVYGWNKHPNTILCAEDVRKVKPEDILREIGKKIGEVDVLEGSPPCASFSTAGKRQKYWGAVKDYSDTRQRTDDLFKEYIRIVRGLKPKVFIAENVKGLSWGVARYYLKVVLAALRYSGYKVTARLLDASWLGVPQHRERIIILGVREDLGVDPECLFPKLFRSGHRYSLRDALPNIKQHGSVTFGFEGKWRDSATEPAPTILGSPSLREGNGTGMVEAEVTDEQADEIGQELAARVAHSDEIVALNHNAGGWDPRFSRGPLSLDEPAPTILAQSATANHLEVMAVNETQKKEADMSKYATGAEWEKLKEGEASKEYFQLVKPATENPCPTVTAAGGNPSAASVAHPAEKRKFYIWELKRICSFPGDFLLSTDVRKNTPGDYARDWERLGRSVPPLMMRAVACSVRRILDEARSKQKEKFEPSPRSEDHCTNDSNQMDEEL